MGLIDFFTLNVKRFKKTRDVKKLMKALAYGRERVIRRQAAESLGSIADARATEALIAALADEDEGVRRAAIDALGRIADPKALVPLFSLKGRNANSTIQSAAESAIAKIPLDARAVGPLLDALKSEGSAYSQAVEALDNLQDSKAVGCLVDALKDKSRWVRGAAARALGNIGDPRAIEPLIKALGDQEIRHHVANALIKIGDSRTVDRFIRALDDPSEVVRHTAVRVLKSIGDNKAAEPVIRMLRDSSSDVRRAAANALESLGWEPRDLDRIYWLIAKTPPLQMARVMKQEGETAVEPLIQTLQTLKRGDMHYYDEGRKLRIAAANALGTIGDARAVDALSENLENSEDMYGIADEAYGIDIPEGLKYYTWPAVWSLVQIGDPRALEPLLMRWARALSDPYFSGKESPFHALRWGFGKLSCNERAVQPLIQALKNSNGFVRSRAIEALRQLRDARAADPFLQALNDPHPDVREQAALGLGEIGDPRAAESLIRVASGDKQLSVRTAAQRALNHISFGR